MDTHEINGVEEKPITPTSEPRVDVVSDFTQTEPMASKFTPAKLLFYAIIQCLLAYGACAFGGGFNLEPIGFTLGSLLNLGAAATAIAAIVRTFTYKPSTVKKSSWAERIVLILLSLAVVGWGGCWGLIGLENF